MINIDELIGDLVYISFNQIEIYSEIGIKNKSGHFIIKGYDHIGLWLEHPGLIIINKEKNVSNKKGNDIIEANFLVTWNNIHTIMHYPNREGYDFPNEFAQKKIGFKINSKK